MADSSSPKPTAGSNTPNDTGFIPGDDTFTKWRNIFTILTGQMSAEGRQQYLDAKDIRDEAADCRRCENHRDYLLKYSPVIRFLQDNIKQLGGDISNHNVYCRRCPQRQAGGFDPDFGIKICANQVRTQSHLEDTIAHEMIHAYDHLRFKVDWHTNMRHAACAEIRASSLSGECRWATEFFTRGQWKLTQQHQECVRRRAALSVSARPLCRDEKHARQIVDEVWDSCFRDTRPFDEIYR
ncbi:mitochondrial inner membrane protease ATP23 [Polytolypa hystricis UAMH7299]|uniref:Mitochondrial inner membrane protease ATP23 n=1 Tax=Polytolypa hystricis (strain UAMH7299) TaxID=1447883 RepID=A0A2B7YAN3_POLH7|nr:mitochondrial inner membrane protease ATP23 [Polytolypa hystricis UAMH7299]